MKCDVWDFLTKMVAYSALLFSLPYTRFNFVIQSVSSISAPMIECKRQDY